MQLALVSLSQLYQRTSAIAPPGINWMKAAALGLFVSVFNISIIHGWTFILCAGSDPDPEKATTLRHASLKSGAVMLFTAFAVIPSLVCVASPHLLLLLALLMLLCGSLMAFLWWQLKAGEQKEAHQEPCKVTDSSRECPAQSVNKAGELELDGHSPQSGVRACITS